MKKLIQLYNWFFHIFTALRRLKKSIINWRSTKHFFFQFHVESLILFLYFITACFVQSINSQFYKMNKSKNYKSYASFHSIKYSNSLITSSIRKLIICYWHNWNVLLLWSFALIALWLLLWSFWFVTNQFRLLLTNFNFNIVISAVFCFSFDITASSTFFHI